MVRLVTVCSMICFLEIKRYQTFIIQKGAPYVVFVFRFLLHWCFYVLTVYSDSKLVPVWLSVWFLPLEEVLCVVIQAPAIRYICVSFALAIWFFDISKNRFKFPVRGCQLIESPDMRLFVGYIICPTSLWYYQIAFRHHHFYYSIQFWKNYEKMWWFALCTVLNT